MDYYISTEDSFFKQPDLQSVKNPGQHLIQSLNRPRQMTSKLPPMMTQNTLRDKQLEPKHAMQSDLTIFGQPAAEVRGLFTDVSPAVGDPQALKDLQNTRKSRHDAAWKGYLERKQQCYEQLVARIERRTLAFRDFLDKSTRRLDEEYEQLEDDRLMRLSEQGVRAVWDLASSNLSERQAELAAYRKAIDDAENYWRVDNEKVLMACLRVLMEVAYMSEGQVERLLEQEVLGLNCQALDRRRTAADLIKRLQVAEVEQDRSRRSQWEEGLRRWRGLRTQHAINTFNARICSPEFADPADRAGVMSETQAQQQTFFDGVMKRFGALRRCLPPNLSTAAVQEWMTATTEFLAQWEAAIARATARLEAMDEALEARARELLEGLRGEVMQYGSITTAEDCQALLDQHVEPVLSGRRDTAQQLISQFHAFLVFQRSTWRRYLRQVGVYVHDLAALHERERTAVERKRRYTAHAMDVTTDQFEEDNRSREDALAAAITQVQQGSSETDLDERVTASIQILEEIEQSYRDFHGIMSDTVSVLPSEIRDILSRYQRELLARLQIKRKEKWEPVEHKPIIREGPTPVLRSLSKRSLGGSRKSSFTMMDSIENAAPPPALIKTKKGARYDFTGDLYERIFSAGVEGEFEPVIQRPSAGSELTPAPSGHPAELAAALDAPDTDDETEDADRPFAGLPASPSMRDRPLSKQSVKDAESRPPSQASKKELAAAPSKKELPKGTSKKEIGPGRRASQLTAELAAPVPEEPELEAAPEEASEPAPPPPPPAPPPMPVAPDGSPLLLDLSIAPEPLRALLAIIQEALISEFESYNEETSKSVQVWAEEQELQLTESLDQNLRRLRPRAGRIEEEIRQIRSVELMGQKRKVDAHLRQLARTFRTSGANFDERQRREEEALRRVLAKLEHQTQLLFMDMSTKSIDIRCREAAAARGHFERQLAVVAERMKKSADDEAARMMAINAKFDQEVLKGFKDGGRFDEENLTEHRRRLEEAVAAIERQRSKQHAAVDVLRNIVLEQADEAVKNVHAHAPVHKEDLALIEALDAAMQSTRTKALKLFDESASQEEKSQRLLDRLALLVLGDGAANMKPYDACQEIVTNVDQLRQELSKRGRSLQCLKAGLNFKRSKIRATVAAEDHPADDPLVDEDEDEEAPPEPVKGKTPAKGGKPAASSATPARGGKNAAAAPPPEPTGPPMDSMNGLVYHLIEECHVKCEEVASAYYSKRAPERAITRPKRIPEQLEQLRGINNTFLDDIRAQLRVHVGACSHKFKDQIIQLARILLPLPGVALDLLATHELRSFEGKAKEVDEDFFKRRQTLQAQLLKNRAAMKPAVAIPSMKKEVEKLISEESRRTDRAVAAIKDRAKDTIYELAVRISAAQRRLVELARQLAKMFDQFVMPEDLESTPGAAAAAPQQQPAGAAAASATATTVPGSGRPGTATVPAPPAAVPPAAAAAMTSGGGARMNIKQLKRLAIAQAQSAGEDGPGPVEGRAHFRLRVWELPEGQLRVGQSGWEEEDDDMVGGVDLMEDDEDSEVVFAKEEDRILKAVDTPAHRSIIRAYGSAVEKLQDHMGACIANVKVDLTAALEEQDLIRVNFNKLAQLVLDTAGLAEDV